MCVCVCLVFVGIFLLLLFCFGFGLALGESLHFELSFLLAEGENIIHIMKAHYEFLSKAECQLAVCLGL